MPTQKTNSSEQLNDLSGGWIPSSFSWTFLSADSPSFVVTTPQNVTGTFGVGMKMQLTHQSTIKNFIITAISLTGTTTYLNLYGGTDYTLNVTGAITNPLFSWQKSPFGFNTDPSKWTVEVTDTTLRTQSSPVQNTWYNLGSLSISIPIGKWSLEYFALLFGSDNSGTIVTFITMSTANNSESDADLTAGTAILLNVSTDSSLYVPAYKRKNISLESKTIYYVNSKTTVSGQDTIGIDNAAQKFIVRAVCAYL